MSQPPLLEVRNLTKHFPIQGGILGRSTAKVHAVNGVSFTVDRGETVAIVGETGCGKSTVGKAILRLFELTDGEVLLDGQRIDNLPTQTLRPLRRKVQVVFQDPFSSLNPRLRVRDILAEPIRNFGLATSAQDLEHRLASLMEKVRLPVDSLGRWPHEFSGGQRQRIGIARALSVDPKVVIADEAVSALDVSIRAQIVNLLIDLQHQLGVSYLFISHDMAVVERISHRVAVMYLGQIVEIGPRRAIFENPQHSYTRKLMAAVPMPDPARRRQYSLEASEIPSPARALGDHPVVKPLVEVGPGHFVARHPVGHHL